MNRILIVGGYGIFGGRLAELLEDEAALTIIIGGRSIEKAEAFCKSHVNAKAKLVAARFDRAGDIKAQLMELKPDILVDASGPFQDYGRDAYALIEGCITQKINYLDLADGSEFVAGIKQFDDAAKAAGVFILSGVSSFPVLTACVVKHLSKEMGPVQSITGGIAPSPFAGVGENVIRAIASYSGQRVTVRKNGKFTDGYPLTEWMRYTIAPPGHIPLTNKLFSLVDVPDLRTLPELWPDAKDVWMGAGPVPEIFHRALNGFAWLVRLKLVKILTPLAKLMFFVMNNFRWGEHRGGMFVEVTDGKIKRSWHLLAEGRDGPFIPCMAIEAIMRKIFAGKTIASGARTAIDDVKLEDYNGLFVQRTIYTGVREEKKEPFLYKQILGSSWESLPPQIRAMHEVASNKTVSGVAKITRGSNPAAKFIADTIGFPQEGTDTPVLVNFTVQDGIETWTRKFGDESFSSKQFAGRGRAKHLLSERFGPLKFDMALVPEDGKLKLILRRWSLLFIPLPLFLCPRSDSYEFVENDRFHFNVEISHPLVGRIVHYRGWLRS